MFLIKPTVEAHPDSAIHSYSAALTKAATLWFEFMKRVGVCVGLQLALRASHKSGGVLPWVTALSTTLLWTPIVAWLDRWSLGGRMNHGKAHLRYLATGLVTFVNLAFGIATWLGIRWLVDTVVSGLASPGVH